MGEQSDLVSESWSQDLPVVKKKKEDDEIAVFPIFIADSDGPF